MRKSPAIKRMTKAGRQVRGMPVAKRVRRAPQPAPAHEDAQPIAQGTSGPSYGPPFADMPPLTEEQIEAHSEPYNDLYDKKVVYLRQMAKDAGIKGYSKMNKNQLVEALSS